MSNPYSADAPRIAISAQAHQLSQLAQRGEEIRARIEALCSQLGLLSQEYLIINEAMKVTLEDLNGGIIPAAPNRRFPELNHYDCHDL